MKRLATVAVLSTLLAGCVSDNVELPKNDASGSDEMKRSPCVCVDLDYRPVIYQWHARS